MSKPTIIIDSRIPFINGVLDDVANVLYLTADEITPSAVKFVDALIIRTRTRCDAHLLANSSVKFIATATIGYDHIDTLYCAENHIQWVNAAGCNASSVAQYMGSALAVWSHKTGHKLDGKTLGLVGVGQVGRAVFHLAKQLGMNVILNDPPREQVEGSANFVSLERLQQEADIISFHTPLNSTGNFPTFHLASYDFFDHVVRSPLIINTARGGIINEEALKMALNSKKISDVIIDCWENEPQIDTELLDKAMIATPHIAGYSADGKAKATEMSVHAMSRFFHFGLDNFSVVQLKPRLKQVVKRAEWTELMMKNYAIITDDKSLRSNPKAFEQLRSSYPIRREVEWLVVEDD